MTELDGMKAYTFVEKGEIFTQSVRKGNFEDKKQVKVCVIKQSAVILQPKTNTEKAKVRII